MKLPNILTLSRILILPIFLFFFFSPQIRYNLYIAGALFIISSLTDLFDGYIARKYNLESDLGRILDPLADKLTLISVFISLYYKGIIYGGFVIIVLLREFVIVLGAIYVFISDESEIIQAGLIGKGATFLLYLAAGLYILDFTIININLNFIKFIMLLAIPLTIISGLSYCIKGYKYIYLIKN